MPTIAIDTEVEVAQEPLFEELADHAGMGRFTPVKRAELLREGPIDSNGEGALRRVYFKPVGWVDEEIILYEAPSSFEYLIVKFRPLPFDHKGGRIALEPLGPERTRLRWTSTYEVPIPLIGGAIARILEGRLEQGFRAIIVEATALAAARSDSVAPASTAERGESR